MCIPIHVAPEVQELHRGEVTDRGEAFASFIEGDGAGVYHFDYILDAVWTEPPRGCDDIVDVPLDGEPVFARTRDPKCCSELRPTVFFEEILVDAQDCF